MPHQGATATRFILPPRRGKIKMGVIKPFCLLALPPPDRVISPKFDKQERLASLPRIFDSIDLQLLPAVRKTLEFPQRKIKRKLKGVGSHFQSKSFGRACRNPSSTKSTGCWQPITGLRMRSWTFLRLNSGQASLRRGSGQASLRLGSGRATATSSTGWGETR